MPLGIPSQPVELPRTIAAVADSRLVDELTEAVYFDVRTSCGTHYDRERKELDQVPASVLVASHYSPSGFLPSALYNERTSTPKDLGAFWYELGSEVVKQAFKTVLKDDTAYADIHAVDAPSTRMEQAATVAPKDRELSFFVDTAAEYSEDEIAGHVRVREAAIRSHIRKAIATVLEDQAFLATTIRRIRVESKINGNIVVEQQVARLETIQRAVEKPEEAAAYYLLLNQVVDCLGLTGVEVVPLPIKEALNRCAAALYVPAQGKGKAQVMIPMSQLGTKQILELAESFDLLAHELAHHLMISGDPSGKFRSEPVHGFTHSTLAHLVREAINELRISVTSKDGTRGGIQIRAYKPDDLEAAKQDLLPFSKLSLTSQIQKAIAETNGNPLAVAIQHKDPKVLNALAKLLSDPNFILRIIANFFRRL